MASQSRVRILLAEDNPEHRRLLGLSLTNGRPHVDVRTVSSGEEFTRLLAGAPRDAFDCLILDFNLPDSDAARLLRDRPKKAEGWPAIVVSSSNDQHVVIESVRHGSADFVPKSEAIIGDTLWHRVELAMAGRQRRRQRRQQLERRHRKLLELAETDALTGLGNRLSLDRFLGAPNRASGQRGTISVILLDADHFKAINDGHGHAAGDRVLCGIADVLRADARCTDQLCRYGGEEFVIIRVACTLTEALLWAEQVRTRIGQLAFMVGDATIGVTASMGVTSVPCHELGPDALAQADAAMYLAKRRGRNRVCTFPALAFEKALEDAQSISAISPEIRLHRVLTDCACILGPTQREHLTTHSEYVSRMSVRFGHALGMHSDELERLRLAGRCHDIGKHSVPEEVLAKPGPLSREEKALLSRHADDGAEVCLRLGMAREAADNVRYHHTRFDGQGAPAGIRGQSVPLGARILAVADAFVAMRSERSYRPARSSIAAIQELRRACGTQFDPDVIHAITVSAHQNHRQFWREQVRVRR